ncbi:hypothetical protein [Ekhidna sp.]|uniref:hypothetical protein n=1 Tax=Ekhidna sp. TaxID=2608089 RepID=UPI003B508190
MKNLLQLAFASLLILSCQSNDDIQMDIPNTENSMVITGINESISYEFKNANGRTESSVPQDVNMIQILILDGNDDVVYEQYHYNANAYNYYYYDSAAHGGDDYTFENTIPDTLYIPPLPDGSYTVLASTAYAERYNYYEDNESYPFIESYQISDGPIYVAKASAEVTQDTDHLVVLDMNNISSRIDLNVTATNSSEWSLEIQLESTNGNYYSFKDEALVPRGNDHYDYAYMWTDSYWKQQSFYMLPRDLKNIHLMIYEYQSGLYMTMQTEIDPKLSLGTGDVFTLNINLDEIIAGGGSAAFSWENIDWNDVGNVTIP